MSTIVTTQAELDAAIDAGKTDIVIDSPRGVWVTLDRGVVSGVRGVSCVGPVYGSATVSGVGDSATVRAYGSAYVRAYDAASVEAYGSATVRASGSASVWASGSASVRAYGSAYVRAYNTATVRATGSASVRASGSATVRAYGSASVRAYGSAYVRAYDAASVEAYGSATVRASGSASVWAYATATVEATPYVAIHKMSRDARITGGTVIDIPALDLTDMHVWADYHGTTIADGILTAFKAVGDGWQTDRKGWPYQPRTTVTADDWDGEPECGGGLHLCATPRQSRRYYGDATRYVECAITLADGVVVVGDKVKARTVRVVREVTIDGEPIS